jgi:hypothetical protein
VANFESDTAVAQEIYDVRTQVAALVQEAVRVASADFTGLRPPGPIGVASSSAIVVTQVMAAAQRLIVNQLRDRVLRVATTDQAPVI